MSWTSGNGPRDCEVIGGQGWGLLSPGEHITEIVDRVAPLLTGGDEHRSQDCMGFCTGCALVAGVCSRTVIIDGRVYRATIKNVCSLYSVA